jgi:pimeloyl-ACP methyl ester carboxylesterase
VATYVLVHGFCHGAWCWYKVIPRLQKEGHAVLAPDLPSLGKDRTPISEVTLDKWTDAVTQVLDAQTEPVILVGHSRGGIVISQAAERRPERVKELVYVAAALIPSGALWGEIFFSDGTSLIIPNLLVAEDQSYATVREDVLKEVFYGDCSEEDVTLAKSLLAPEPLVPNFTGLSLTKQNFERVPRVYIECLRDKAVPLSLQRKMYGDLPCQKVISMDTDHSPFFSAPDELVAHLISL